MVGWHHWLDEHKSEWTPGIGDGQGGLACCDSQGRKESDTTERLIWSDDEAEFGEIPKICQRKTFLLATLYNDNSTSGLEPLELVCEYGLFVKIKVIVIGKNILLTMGNNTWPLVFLYPFLFSLNIILTNLTTILPLLLKISSQWLKLMSTVDNSVWPLSYLL